MVKAKKRRAISSVVTGALLLAAVSVMGIALIAWANTNLTTHQMELDEAFTENHNRINERILMEHIWFGGTGPSINITMSNTGTLGLNVTQIKIQNIDSGQYYTYAQTDGGIVYQGEKSFNQTLAWSADTAYDISITTDRGNIFKTEVLTP